MKIKIKTIALATLAASLITVSAARSFAEEPERRLPAERNKIEQNEHRQEAERYRDREGHWQNYGEQLKAAREKLAHDQAHHASRKKLAADENAIAQLETDMRVARRR